MKKINEEDIIFYIEDDVLTNESLSFSLNLIYKNVNSFLNAQIAIDKINEGFIPNLIISDIRMPDIDGIALIRYLKEKNLNIPVILTTAHNETEYLHEAIKFKVEKYFVKPIQIKELFEATNEILEKQREENYKELIIQYQKTMTVITDGKKIKYVNKSLLNFFNFKEQKEIMDAYPHICELFLKSDDYFHIKQINEDTNFIEELLKKPCEERVVAINSLDNSFHISLKKTKTEEYILNFNDITRSFKKQIDLEKKVEIDNLTGVYNRSYFESNIKSLLEKNKQKNLKTAIVVADIDNFKLINDNYGHEIGDKVLKKFVEVIQMNSRADDILIRWGGEEFILILSIKNIYPLSKIVQNLCDKIEETEIETVKGITCSFGATIYKDEESIDTTINRADLEMYRSKNNGRNQISIKI